MLLSYPRCASWSLAVSDAMVEVVRWSMRFSKVAAIGAFAAGALCLSGLLIRKNAPAQREQLADAPPSVKYPSLDVALEYSLQQMQTLLSTADALDTKAGLVLASGSLLVSVLIAWHAVSLSIGCSWGLCHNRIIQYDIATFELGANAIISALPLLAVLVFVLVIVSASRAYALRDFHNAPWPAKFQEHLSQSAESTKYSLYKYIANFAFVENSKMLKEKVKLVRQALIAFWVEAAIVCAMLAAQILLSHPIRF